MSTITYEATLATARQLPLTERLRLASTLAGEAANEIPSTSMHRPLTPDAARSAWAQLRQSMRALPNPRPTLGEQLEADRHDRDRALLGHSAEHNDVDA